MLRKRKNRRYNETNDEEGDGERKFDVIKQINSERFVQSIHREKHLQELPGKSITLKYIQKYGFDKPILVAKPDGLNLRVPPESFLVRDVRNHVGHQRIIDVMDVKTQKNIEMSMKDWCKYYESKNRDRLLNVISLEFSHTDLDELVDSPTIVKLLDWVDLVWPKFLKQSQTESTNTIDKMKYPKVQKYCLMSVKGSYTDFHIDFGGTSVWYHILRGKKIFWMVPPTELNLQIFEEWTLSGMQQDVFFGDTVEECFRVELCAGNTFFIPSGWIHAVYTLEDSLVFGGNFLHSFGIENQLKISKIEDATKVPIKFRYPFYTEILWYVVQHYVYCLTDKDHLHRPEITPPKGKPTIAKISNSSNISHEDAETTESDHEDSDSKNKKIVSPKKRSRNRPTKTAPKRQKKNQPPTDDESTDIDSANEELYSSSKKPVNTTCRMTKNSLLRLQYEVDEQKSSSKSTGKSDESDSTGKSLAKKKATVKDTSLLSKQKHPTTLSTMDLAVMMLSNEIKMNGWSSSTSGHSVWSNPTTESKGPKRIHITKFELNGLKVLVKHLSKLSGTKKNLPVLIRNSRALLDDCRKLIAEHEHDDPELAITGLPITPEILKTPENDMNELIGQFFKPSDTTEESAVSQHITTSQPIPLRTKADTSPSTTQHRRLNLNNDPDGLSIKCDDKKTMSTSNNNDSATKSPNKETKCLSPNKKLLSQTTTSSPPPRPKSPPTRPLSSNQYTSKTKNNNNLLLPGSFADLIAATSTEKKVFDVSGVDAASTLFAIKDLGSGSKPPQTSSTKNTASSKVDSKGGQISKSKSSGTIKSIPYIDPTTPATSSGAGARDHPPNIKPISPEPPKPAAIQKRFINPSFKPINKEKLIFASAPYISPVHASDQLRSNNLYPWQSATPAALPIHSQAYSPAPPKPAQHSGGSASGAQTSYTPQDSCTLNHASNRSVSPSRQQSDQTKHPQSSVDHTQVDDSQVYHPHQSSNKDPSQVNVIVKSHQQHSTNKDSTVDNGTNPAQVIPIAQSKSSVAANNNTVSQTDKVASNDAGDTKAKKPTKPRGPPKKSKEARQAIESIPETTPSPVSVIKISPPASSAGNLAPSANQAQPKVKNKRTKKQKDSTPSSPAPSTTTSNLARTHAQPSVICGLVAPPTSSTAAGSKINPQSYLISRPLLFNTMPTFSAAQFQQMPRVGMPLMTEPIGPHMGLNPLHQGARIVWATQPRLPPPINTNESQPLANLTTAKTQPRLPATLHADNAALLSLATTALSTAPMISSPALSHLSQRAPTPQAIMVSSASQQSTLLTHPSPFFSPFVQRMPMTHFVARPGVPRPTGQLVFARLPTQAAQPRYLITPPGFINQRFQSPHIVTSQPTSSLAFAAFKPPDQAKVMKTNKVDST